ncbi:MAG: hypothetical protein ABGW69_01295 [Nanoarchaeota archaeon]
MAAPIINPAAIYDWITTSLVGYIISGIFALLILVVGYFVSTFAGWLTKWILVKAKVEQFLEKTGRADAFGGYRFSDIVGTIVKWALFSAFIATAANYLGWGLVSDLIAQISAAILIFLYGAVIFLIGLFIADIVADYISNAKELPHRVLVSRIVRTIIIILAADVALRSMGVNIAFVENIILIIIAGISLGAAIALGFAFGEALKPQAKKIVEKAEEKIRKKE